MKLMKAGWNRMWSHHKADLEVKEAPPAFVVVVTVIQGRNIKKMDKLDDSDAYMKVSSGKTEYKTKVVKDSKRPVWGNLHCKFVYQTADQKPKTILLECFDHNKIKHDELIGSATLVLDNVWDKAPQWEWIQLKDKAGADAGEVQCHWVARSSPKKVKSQADLSIEMNAAANYTHLFAINVLEARNLKQMDRQSKDDAFVRVQWGEKLFQTDAVKNSEHPKWNSDCVFWVDETKQGGYQLVLSVLDHDGNKKEDEIGTAYLKGEDLFALAKKSPPETFTQWIAITSLAKSKDKDMGKGESLLDTKEVRGDLQVAVTVSSKEDVMERFFTQLLDDVDADKSGTLSKDEIKILLALLDVEMSEKDFEHWFSVVDVNKDGVLNKSEVLTFIGSLEEMDAKTSARLLDYLAYSGTEEGRSPLNRKPLIMEGITHQRPKGEIEVLERGSGLILKENIPKYIEVALKAMFAKGVKRITTSHYSETLMTRLSVKQGKAYDDEKSVKDIPGFVKLHNLDVSEVEKPLSEYKCFNEFFFRSLKPSARPISEPEDNRVLTSPADCRLTVFPEMMDATKLWIKGENFTVENLFASRAQELASKFVSGALMICRLAPQDYHRWHWPVSGKVTKITHVAGNLLTVNPIAVNKPVDVYTANKRCIIEIDTADYGTVVMIAIGAMMVGSITLLCQEGTAGKKGDQQGYFAFGGSTVLVLFERGSVRFDEDLVKNSKRPLETLVKCNSHLGKAARGSGGASPKAVGAGSVKK